MSLLRTSREQRAGRRNPNRTALWKLVLCLIIVIALYWYLRQL